jgi:hypothetical protein
MLKNTQISEKLIGESAQTLTRVEEKKLEEFLQNITTAESSKIEKIADAEKNISQKKELL